MVYARARPVGIVVLAVAVALQPMRLPRVRSRVIRGALPMRPSPDLEPIEIVNACFGGLQQPDEPLPDAGYERLFYFCTYTCRKAITARMGADSLANFTKHTELSPAVQPDSRTRLMALSALANYSFVDAAALVEAGLAVAYRQYSMKYVPQEEAAYTSRRGMWQGQFMMPWDYRRQ